MNTYFEKGFIFIKSSNGCYDRPECLRVFVNKWKLSAVHQNNRVKLYEIQQMKWGYFLNVKCTC